jgi:hypothetical protein
MSPDPQSKPDNIHFDNPSDIESKLNDPKFFAQFLYGLGSFLSYKEELANKRLSNLNDELAKLDDEFNNVIENFKSVLGEGGDDDKSMRGSLQEAVQKTLSENYESKYNEFIAKKQSYKMVLQFIQNRRAYIVYDLGSANPGELIKKSIVDRAKIIYGLYRGDKYKDIRMKVFDLLNTLTYSSASLKSSFQLNLVVTGPAGSGKTTIARELSKWYSELGLFTSDGFNENPDIAFSESGRTNFIGQYTGQTAPKTLLVLFSNIEKTLFMDEAYSIAGCNFDRTTGKIEPDAYGEEFISELLRFMNDHKGMSAIIVAGYKNLMTKCFMERNEGLPRRFPTAIDLPLSSTDELFNIFLKIVVEKSYEGASQYNKTLENEKKKLNNLKKLEDDPEALQLLNDKIADKQVKLKKYEDRIKEIKMQKIKFYCIMKPTFMMLHMDTSFPAVELLRKYLLMIQLRIQYEGDTTVTLDNVYSYTIVTQVLICLLETQLQRNILRRHFYADVFSLEDVNLSLFKAQAGEMGLIADLCTKTIGAEAALRDASGKVLQKTVSIEEEMNLMNTYFYDKGFELKLYQLRDVVQTGGIGEENVNLYKLQRLLAGKERKEGATALEKDLKDVRQEAAQKYQAERGARNMFSEEAERAALREASRAAELRAQDISQGENLAQENEKSAVAEIEGRLRQREDALEPALEPKNNEPNTPKPQSTKYYMEVIKRGKDLAEFQEKINKFLSLEDLFENLPGAVTASTNPSAVSPLPSTAPEKSKEKTKYELELERKKQDATDSLADLFIDKKLEKIAQTADDPVAYFESAKDVIDKLKLPEKTEQKTTGQKGSADSLPSLSDLFKMLHEKDKRDELIRHMVNIYFRKNNPRYINSLLDKIPTEFPIHLERTELEFESKEMNNQSLHYNKVLNKVIEYNNNIFTNLPAPSLENSKMKLLTGLKDGALQKKTLTADILWEDIGIF